LGKTQAVEKPTIASVPMPSTVGKVSLVVRHRNPIHTSADRWWHFANSWRHFLCRNERKKTTNSAAVIGKCSLRYDFWPINI